MIEEFKERWSDDEKERQNKKIPEIPAALEIPERETPAIGGSKEKRILSTTLSVDRLVYVAIEAILAACG